MVIACNISLLYLLSHWMKDTQCFQFYNSRSFRLCRVPGFALHNLLPNDHILTCTCCWQTDTALDNLKFTSCKHPLYSTLPSGLLAAMTVSTLATPRCSQNQVVGQAVYEIYRGRLLVVLPGLQREKKEKRVFYCSSSNIKSPNYNDA